MEEADRECLRKNYKYLMQQMPVDSVLDYLWNAGIINDIMAGDIRDTTSIQRRAQRLLLTLPKRGPRAYSVFCNALRSAGRDDMADVLVRHGILSQSSTSFTQQQARYSWRWIHCPSKEELERNGGPNPVIVARGKRTFSTVDECYRDSQTASFDLPCCSSFFLVIDKQSV